MDDRIEHFDDSAATSSNAIGRREMLQRTGFVLGATALWATPVVQTIGLRPAAATTLPPNACVIDDNGKYSRAGTPSSLTWTLEPSPCDWELDTTWKDLYPNLWDPEANKTTFYGECCDLGKYLSENDGATFDVYVRGDSQPPSDWFDLSLSNYPVQRLELSSGGVISYGSEVRVGGGANNVGPNNYFLIFPTGVDDPATGCSQRFSMHTSCSQPLVTNDRHGSVRLQSFVL